MQKAAGSAVEPAPGMRPAHVCAAVATSLLMTAALILIGDMTKWHLMLMGALLFSGAAVFVLMGDILQRLVYFFIMGQMAVELLGIPLSFLGTTGFALLFIPLILMCGDSDKINSVPFRRPLALLLMGWLAAFIYVGLFKEDAMMSTSRHNLQFLLGIGVAYMVFYSLRMKLLDVHRLLFYIALSGLPLILVTLARYVVKGDAGMILGDRFGMLASVNPNLIAVYLSMAFPGALFAASYAKWGLAKRALLYASAALYLTVILMTASRSAFLWLPVIAVWFLWRKRSVTLLLGMLAGAAAAFFTVGSKMVDRMFNPTTTDMMSNFGRFELLKAAFRILEANYYALGIGMNSFALSKFDHGYQSWIEYGKNTGLSSHNAYLEVWMGWGILGIIGWLALNIGVMRALIRNWDDKYDSVSKAVAFALLSYLLIGLADSSIASFAIMFPFFILLGAAFFLIAQKKQTEGIAEAQK